ncbi:MAG: Fructokinase [uncultured Cytophagales bacterium]|uniref:Fructokinase n=1 Tax=uncultured Cytophagales bacterium TaxID=158755 RepID=A0A6J4ICN4_9SPHI|nr:MAG: Fructokinase [uncultured Cytophagales bacterium]
MPNLPTPDRNGGVLALGEALIDAVTTDFVTDLSEARTLGLHPGGSPANLCRFVRASGGAATLVAAVGRDGLGKILLDAMAAAGIDPKHVQQLAGHATSLIVVGRSRGTPDFIPYRDADRFLQPVDEALIAAAAVVHTTAFALSLAPARDTILDAFSKAHARGIAVSVDWNYAEPVWGTGNDAAEVFNQLMQYRPLLKVSLDDVQRFTGAAPTVEAAKDYLRALPAVVTCLTCGAEGVWYRENGEDWRHQPAEPVVVKDATGAGDAFWAGFLTARMAGQPTEGCVQRGIATAARRLRGEL